MVKSGFGYDFRGRIWIRLLKTISRLRFWIPAYTLSHMKHAMRFVALVLLLYRCSVFVARVVTSLAWSTRSTSSFWPFKFASLPVYKFFPLYSFFLQSTVGAPKPAAEADTDHHSTLTHTAGHRQHRTPPSSAPNPCKSAYQQSLTPSYALQVCSFPRLTAAKVKIYPHF